MKLFIIIIIVQLYNILIHRLYHQKGRLGQEEHKELLLLYKRNDNELNQAIKF